MLVSVLDGVDGSDEGRIMFIVPISNTYTASAPSMARAHSLLVDHQPPDKAPARAIYSKSLVIRKTRAHVMSFGGGRKKSRLAPVRVRYVIASNSPEIETPVSNRVKEGE